tara:strand:+ start:719 stop:1042 length:324 start_codon:yes stop_codon:yes gene_type:complete
MTDITTALLSLTPTAEWTVRGTEIEWHSKDISQPSDDVINAKIDELKAAEPMRLLREERNRLIAETDHWVLSDTAEATSAQTKYRQQLRDITKTATSLDDVSWPEVP